MGKLNLHMKRADEPRGRAAPEWEHYELCGWCQQLYDLRAPAEVEYHAGDDAPHEPVDESEFAAGEQDRRSDYAELVKSRDATRPVTRRGLRP